MRARYGAILAALCVAAGAPHALAAARPSCLQVVDAAGDGTSGDVVPSRDALDILSADVATGRRNLVAVVRLASADADPTLTGGVTYRFGWRAGGVDQVMTLMRYSDGSQLAEFDPNTAVGASGDVRSVQVRIDPATSSVTWTLPRKSNPVLAKKGTKFSALTVTADPALNLKAPSASPVGVSGAVSFIQGDSASSGKTYTDLMPSCVKGV